MSTKTRVTVKVRNNNIDKALSIFKKKVKSSGILQKYRENQEFIKPSTKKRQKRLKNEYLSKKNSEKN